ncbi:hypothetical protein NM208_g3350 [Fusarium decemcellulare]|uniref:Uncharacterized protein n=1 Tax=Fusarium decemcellulare TaxID=57161 RepID=A0ACC1SPL6_9HYPO|nr:hypothetical protein NM208_g3350 [Fusarium decemcellulare]
MAPPENEPTQSIFGNPDVEPVKNDINDTEWQMLAAGYPTYKAIHILARASPACMRRWKAQMPLEFVEFVKTQLDYPIQFVKTFEEEKKLAEHVRKWAREEACRDWVPVRNSMGRVIEYREIRIDPPYDWTRVWNSKEGFMAYLPVYLGTHPVNQILYGKFSAPIHIDFADQPKAYLEPKMKPIDVLAMRQGPCLRPNDLNFEPFISFPDSRFLIHELLALQKATIHDVVQDWFAADGFHIFCTTELRVTWSYDEGTNSWTTPFPGTEILRRIHKYAKDIIRDEYTLVQYRGRVVEYILTAAIPPWVEHEGVIDMDRAEHLRFYYLFIHDMHWWE